jgi:hypothetical protein
MLELRRDASILLLASAEDCLFTAAKKGWTRACGRDGVIGVWARWPVGAMQGENLDAFCRYALSFRIFMRRV